MPIPGFQSLMLPVLKSISDGKEHEMHELTDLLADQFQLTENEKKELLPSGMQTIFYNRVGWARTYMRNAGLLDIPRRKYISITTRGLEILKQNPPRIDTRFLKQFPEFVEFQTRKKIDGENSTDESLSQELSSQTPEEILENSYQALRNSLVQELIHRILEQPPNFFERLVVELIVKMGYGGSIKDAGKAIGKSGDEGIDGTIKEDKLGLDIIYIQAKRWQLGTIIGRPEIHKFIGALAGQGAKKGIFITTSSFTKDAMEYKPLNETKIVLIDGNQLAQLHD